MAASTSGLARPQKPNLTAVSYPSPPTSPLLNKSTPANITGVSKDGARLARTVSPIALSPPTTPVQHRSAASKAAAAARAEKDKEQAVSALKTRLSLDCGQCGGRRKDGGACRWTWCASKLAELAPLLESMTDLTQASTELDAKLDELVSRWHCHNHDSGASKEARIECWRIQFPAGKAVNTNPAALIEKQIRKLLNLESTYCIGISSRKLPCRSRIGGQKVQYCTTTIAEIVKPEVYLNDENLEWLLEVLETSMYCHWHTGRPLKRVEGWKSAIGAIRGNQLDESKAKESDAPERTTTPSQLSRILRSSVSPTKHGTGSSALRSGEPSSSLNPRRDPSTYWTKKYDTSPFHIIAKSDALADSQHDRIKRKMMQGLLDKDRKDGYVYAFQVQGNPGYVKIGYTTRSVKERHEEWRFECNRDPEALYPATSGTVAIVRNAPRVEALCHEDLGHRRIRIYCSACMMQHLEWFEVSSTEAIAVIQKWSKWMATDPYQPVTLRSGEKWTIRDEERKRTMDMKTFIQQISGAIKPAMNSRIQVDGSKIEAVIVAENLK